MILSLAGVPVPLKLSPQRGSLIVWHLEAKSIAYIQEARDLQALVRAVLAPMPLTLVP